MEAIWKLAVPMAGLGAIVSFVIWSIYREWLRLPIFQTMTKDQQYRLFRLFLILTFFFGIAGLAAMTYQRDVPTARIDEIQLTVNDLRAELGSNEQSSIEELGALAERLSGLLDSFDLDFNRGTLSTEQEKVFDEARATHEEALIRISNIAMFNKCMHEHKAWQVRWNAVRRDETKVEKAPACMERQVLIDLSVSGWNLSGINWRGVIAKYGDFSKADLTWANMAGAKLPGANFTEAAVHGVKFRNADLSGADFRKAEVVNSDFFKANLEGADLSSLEIKDSYFIEANLKGARIDGTKFHNVDFQGVDFTGIDVSKAMFTACKNAP